MPYTTSFWNTFVKAFGLSPKICNGLSTSSRQGYIDTLQCHRKNQRVPKRHCLHLMIFLDGADEDDAGADEDERISFMITAHSLGSHESCIHVVLNEGRNRYVCTGTAAK